MNLNEEIKKQELLIEELNVDIDKILSISHDYYDKAFKFISDEIENTQNEIDLLKPQKDSIEEDTTSTNILNRLEKLLKKLEKLELLANNLSEKKKSDLPYNRAVIEFKKPVELNVESLKSPEFQRNLLGTMYFKVVGLDEDNKYILLKTNSFPDTTFIKLEYKKLETYKDQKGDVNLLYSRYKNPNLNVVEGNQQDCYFKFVELS